MDGPDVRGLYGVEILRHKFCAKFWYAICLVFLMIRPGIR